jgi:hypothetical protein
MGQWVHSGHNHADEYMGSGVPYVSASKGTIAADTTTRLPFPRITRWVIVRNTSANALRFGFTAAGVQGFTTAGPQHMTGSTGTNYFLLPGNTESQRLELKCSQMFFKSNEADETMTFCVIAGITNIPTGSMFTVTGSSGVGGVG